MTITRRIALIASGITVLGGVALATPALAQSCPSGQQCVTGQAMVQSTLTLALGSSSFTDQLTPGSPSMSTTIPATVTANLKYALTEEMVPDSTGCGNGDTFQGVQKCGNFIGPAEISPAYGTASPLTVDAPFSSTDPNPETVISTTIPSAASGDAYALGWSFNVPGSQAPDVYSGTIGLTLLAS